MKPQFALHFCLCWAEYFMFVRGLPMQTTNAVLQTTPSSHSHAAEFSRYYQTAAQHLDPEPSVRS